MCDVPSCITRRAVRLIRQSGVIICLVSQLASETTYSVAQAQRGVPVAAEIQIIACGYSAQCSVRGCRARATRLARYTDGQGRPLRQRELCDRHTDWLRANRSNVLSVWRVKESRNEVCLRHPMTANKSLRVIRHATIAFSPNIVQTVAGGPAFGRRALTPALGEKMLTA